MTSRLRGLLSVRTLPWVASGVLLPVAVADLVVGWLLRGQWGRDLGTYLLGSAIGLQHGFGHIYDAGLQAALLKPTRAHWGGFVSPPPVAWAMAPLMALPPEVRLDLWVGLSAAAVIAGALLLARPTLPARLFALLAVLAVPDVMLAVTVGNLICVLFLAVAVATWLAARGEPIAAGVALGLLALKPQVALLLLPVLAIAAQWRVLLGLLCGAGALAVASLLTLGGSGVGQWVAMLRSTSQLVDQQSLSLLHLDGGGPLNLACAVSAAALALGAAWRYRRLDLERPLAVALVGSLPVAPYVNAGDFIWLPAAALLLWRRFDGAYERARIWLLAASAILGEPSTLLVPIAASVAVLLWLVGRRAGPLAERGDRVRLRPDVLGVRPDDAVHRGLLEDVRRPAGNA